MAQVIDILLIDTLNGGDITFDDNSNLQMTRGLDTAVYLCLFGGNLEDDGSAATDKLQWWGNDGEPEDKHFRSRFQNLLRGQPYNSSIRVKLEEAAKYDIKKGIPQASKIDVDISSSVKRLDVEIKIWLKDGTQEYIELGVDL